MKSREVVAGIKEKCLAKMDRSQIENEEEEESWREGDQMAARWDEKQKLEEILERRRMAGSSLQLEVMHKVRSPWCMNACHKAKG